jgi:hypothetical protein
MPIPEMLEYVGLMATIGYLDESYDGSQNVIDKLHNEALLKEQK